MFVCSLLPRTRTPVDNRALSSVLRYGTQNGHKLRERNVYTHVLKISNFDTRFCLRIGSFQLRNRLNIGVQSD
jgi:hypothetical protein